MRVLVAPMMAMAESSGPARRARLLASAMAARGWEASLCVPEGASSDPPEGVRSAPVAVPSPLGMPRFVGRRLFPIAQRLGANRRVTVASFDDVLFLTGNVDARYLATTVELMRRILRAGRFDAAYSEFSLPAIIAARAEGVPVFGTASFPTQPSYACDPRTATGVNRILTSLGMGPVRSPEDVLLMLQMRFVPSCRVLEPFPDDDAVVFTGPFSGIPSLPSEEGVGRRDTVVVYLGNGAVTPRRALAAIAKALRGSPCVAYVAGLPEGRLGNVRTAPSFDFSELLPRAAAFVNHGGQNSVMDGIAYGVPQLICPGKVFERRFNAAAARQAGVAVRLEEEHFDAEGLQAALSLVADSGDALRSSAAALRRELSSLGGASRVLDEIDAALNAD